MAIFSPSSITSQLICMDRYFYFIERGGGMLLFRLRKEKKKSKICRRLKLWIDSPNLVSRIQTKHKLRVIVIKITFMHGNKRVAQQPMTSRETFFFLFPLLISFVRYASYLGKKKSSNLSNKIPLILLFTCRIHLVKILG